MAAPKMLRMERWPVDGNENPPHIFRVNQYLRDVQLLA